MPKQGTDAAPTLPSPASGGGETVGLPVRASGGGETVGLPVRASGGGEMVGLPIRASGGGVEARKWPFCRSKVIEVISLFGSQVMTMQCKCLACGNFFEASKY